jgi:hypothetical protein
LLIVPEYLAGELCQATCDPTYFCRPSTTPSTTTPETNPVEPDLTMAVVAGAVGAAVVILVGGYVLLM